MPASIFSGNFVKTLKDDLNLNDTAYVLTGTDDPTSVAQNAPQGSIYMRTGASGGSLYKKQDAGSSTNWTEVSTGLDDVSLIQNATFTATVAGNDLTIALKTKAGADPSASDKVRVAFRNSSDNSGSFTVREVTAATSIVVPNGGTLGTRSGQLHFIYVSLHDNGTTAVLGVSSSILDPRFTLSTSAVGTGSDDAHVVYTGSALTAKPYIIFGRFSSTQTTAGTWATSPINLALGDYSTFNDDGAYVRYSTDAGQSISSATSTRVDFEDFQEDSHNRVTTGASWVFTASRPGRYAVSVALETDSYAWTTNQYFEVQILKNGTAVRRYQNRVHASGTFLMQVQGFAYLQLSENETVAINVEHDRGSATLLRGNGNYNYVEINRISV